MEKDLLFNTAVPNSVCSKSFTYKKSDSNLDYNQSNLYIRRMSNQSEKIDKKTFIK